MLSLTACVEHGRTPDGVSATLGGTWHNSTETAVFDEDTHTMAWTDGAVMRSGTWSLTGTELELTCAGCPFFGTLAIRVDTTHLLIDQVVTGSFQVVPGSSWAGTALERDISCASQVARRSRTVTLDETMAEIFDSVCCSDVSQCDDRVSTVGVWHRSEDGFFLEAGGDFRAFFLMAGGLSMKRSSRQLTPAR